MAGLEERFEEPEEAVEIQVLNEDFSILSFQEPLERADSAWLEAALQSGGGVLQVSGRTVCAVRDDLAVKRVPCQAHTVDSGWTSLRVSAQDLPLSALVAVAYLGPCLARSGLPWRQAGEALLVRKRDLPLATAMWVQAGHLVWPLSALTSPSPSSEPGLEVPGHGVWRLEKIEAPVGVVQELFSGSEGAIRIQSRCGFYAEVRPSEEASCCGRCTALPAAPGVGPGVVVSKSLVNFQPPRAGFWPRHFVRAHDEAMEVIHSLASLRGSVLSRSAERWRRLEGEKAVVLELADDTAKRVGLWLFCGRYFTRVLGHEGVVSSCCCASLGRLKRMRGHVVEDDLRRYEALEGEVEAKGELRITRDVWRQSEGVVLFSSERSSAQLKRSGGQASLLLCLPSGVEEWKVHRWEFDPFDVEEEVQAPRSVRPEPPRHNFRETSSSELPMLAFDRSPDRSGGYDPSKPAPPLGVHPRYGLIGGSGVQVKGDDRWKVSTPWGDCLLASLDPDRRVIFANRHLCTQLDNGQVNYAPPHEVNYRALVWALVVESQCQAVVSLSSTGTLHPEEIPVGSMLSAEDYYMVTPQATTFWGHKQIGSFEPPDRG
ncbi:Probable S-methyl-5'-thioinosine phosphorylase (5'-methylthioinosine phosphorylase) (MTI phosphorylase) (MTIP), partial [Durusdinium trenchii]